MISPGLVGVAHTSDKEAADKQAWSLLPARTSILHARSLHVSTQDSPMCIRVSALKRVGGKRVCTLVPDTHDSRTRRHPLALHLPTFSWVSRPFCLYPRPVMRFPKIHFFFRDEIVSSTPNSQPRGSGSSHLNGLAWETLPGTN